MNKTEQVTERQKRSVECPQCGAAAGRPCESSRIPGANSFGGGWGGPPYLERAHAARRAAYLVLLAECGLDEVRRRIDDGEALASGLTGAAHVAVDAYRLALKGTYRRALKNAGF